MATPTTEKTGFTLWFTGMSGAGKSTLAGYVAQRLRSVGRPVEVLVGEELEKGVGPATSALGSSKEERNAEMRRLSYLAKLLTRNNVVAITANISPYRDARNAARRDIGRFAEVFVDCPVDTLIERDSKGLYRKALAGELPNFTGITDPYEPPNNPEVVVHTNLERVEESAQKIFQALLDIGYLKPVEVSAIIGQKARRRPIVAKRVSRPARDVRHTRPARKQPSGRKAVRARSAGRRVRR